ncbi:MAG TPA: branched-chain amino acid aminotransferase [Actinomycetales bacterium]|nr:branched-chain amino acid aminotransferase [Actinomycetales bacterium]
MTSTTTDLPGAAELAARFPLAEGVVRAADDVREAALARGSFGVDFTDHMAQALFTRGEGWHSHGVVPYGALTLTPSSSVLHYGQEIFEGMKAYRHADGSIWTFRPEQNALRMNASARRMSLPELPVEEFVGGIAALVAADQDWVPGTPGSSLYLRPFMFASEHFLGVRAANEVTFLVVASPVGPYFVNGFQPIDIWVTHEYHRSGPGGTGAAKTAGNYASSLLPKTLAKEQGFDEVLFLDGATSSLVEELGGMNIMAVRADGSVVTPSLEHHTILPGITRASLIQLLHDHGVRVDEVDLPLAELVSGIQGGEITEVFACGTAAVITPIGRLAAHDFDVTVADGAPGELTTRIYEELTGIQYGTREDRHGWMYRLA